MFIKAKLIEKSQSTVTDGQTVQLPAVGVVQVGEEQHATAEECEQHEDPVHFV